MIDLNTLTIDKMFKEAVITNKDNIAIIHKDEKITYGELDKRSNQIANMLIDKGIRKEEIVAIIMDRSIDFIISIFGILKSGAAYMPIHPKFP